MNYIKIYKDLCRSRKSMCRSKSEYYYEKHHIKPKWLGGDDSDDNLVLLTAREHYISHYLLFMHYKDKSSASAFHIMNVSCNMEYRDSKKYEQVRIWQSNNLKGDKNPSKRLEVRRKISEGVSGVKNGMYGMKGELNPFYGMKHSDEFLSYKRKLHGHKIKYKGVVYDSIRHASKSTNISRFLIKKNSKRIYE